MNLKFALFTCLAVLGSFSATEAAENGTVQSVRRNAPKGISETFFSCINQAGSDEDKIGTCIDVEKKAQDARLNKAYSALMIHLDEKSKNSVRTAERAWLEYNDKSVRAETNVGASNQTNNLDVEQAEMFRYCLQANVLERYLFATGH